MTGLTEDELVGYCTAPFPHWPESEIGTLMGRLEDEPNGRTPAGFGTRVKTNGNSPSMLSLAVRKSPLIDPGQQPAG
jgi:hypothetical protein